MDEQGLKMGILGHGEGVGGIAADCLAVLNPAHKLVVGVRNSGNGAFGTIPIGSPSRHRSAIRRNSRNCDHRTALVVGERTPTRGGLIGIHRAARDIHGDVGRHIIEHVVLHKGRILRKYGYGSQTSASVEGSIQHRIYLASYNHVLQPGTMGKSINSHCRNGVGDSQCTCKAIATIESIGSNGVQIVV